MLHFGPVVTLVSLGGVTLILLSVFDILHFKMTHWGLCGWGTWWKESLTTFNLPAYIAGMNIYTGPSPEQMLSVLDAEEE